jgi:uncharacterized protein (TIGR00290 family)
MYGIQTKAAMFWSGGKDSAIALLRVLQAGQYQVRCLIVTTNEQTGRVSMHGVRNELIERQAEAMDIPVRWMPVPSATDHAAYEQALRETLDWLKTEGINHVIFGDVFLEDLRQYRDEFLASAEMEGVYPLWKEDTQDLVHLVIESGIHAMLVCVDGSKLSSAIAGRVLDEQLLAELPADVDPCGENGEFHTFVFDAPYFANPIAITKGELVAKKYAGSETEFWFQDIY